MWISVALGDNEVTLTWNALIFVYLLGSFDRLEWEKVNEIYLQNWHASRNNDELAHEILKQGCIRNALVSIFFY